MQRRGCSPPLTSVAERHRTVNGIDVLSEPDGSI